MRLQLVVTLLFALVFVVCMVMFGRAYGVGGHRGTSVVAWRHFKDAENALAVRARWSRMLAFELEAHLNQVCEVGVLPKVR
jgi:hypothetical protein